MQSASHPLVKVNFLCSHLCLYIIRSNFIRFQTIPLGNAGLCQTDYPYFMLSTFVHARGLLHQVESRIKGRGGCEE